MYLRQRGTSVGARPPPNGGCDAGGIKWESACKPGSVVDSHSSGTSVTGRLEQPTRVRCGPHHAPLFGLAPDGVYPATDCYQPCGALLPHHFTLTCAPANRAIGGMFSAALSVGLRRPGVTWRPALWSPDFPPHPTGCSDCRANSRNPCTARGRQTQGTRRRLRLGTEPPPNHQPPLSFNSRARA